MNAKRYINLFLWLGITVSLFGMEEPPFKKQKVESEQESTRMLDGNSTILDQALVEAVKQGKSEEQMRELLEKGADVNTCFEWGDTVGITPLHFVSYTCWWDTGQLLVEYGADVNAVALKWHGRQGVTPLHIAVERGFNAMVELLISKGAKVNVTDSNGYTPLHYAAGYGRFSCAQLLIKHGADVNSLTLKNQTPLVLALGEGYQYRYPTIKEFLKAGALFNPKDKERVEKITEVCEGQPAVLAAIFGNVEKLEDLINETSQNELKEALLYALAQTHHPIVLSLVAKNVLPLQDCIHILEKLMSSTSLQEQRKGYEKVKKQLIYRLSLVEQILEQMLQRSEVRERVIQDIGRLPTSLGVKVDANAVLLDALSKGAVSVISEALEAGANPNATNKEGASALALACAHPNEQQSEKIVELLLEHGAIPTKELVQSLENKEQRQGIVAKLRAKFTLP